VTPAVLDASESWHELDVEEASAFIAFTAPVFTDDAAVSETLLRALFAGWVYRLENKHDFITDTEVGSFGGVRAPLTVIEVHVDDPKRLEEAVDLVFEQRDKWLEELAKPSIDSAIVQVTRTAAMVNSAPTTCSTRITPGS
jgi:hypothetical protein